MQVVPSFSNRKIHSKLVEKAASGGMLSSLQSDFNIYTTYKIENKPAECVLLGDIN